MNYPSWMMIISGGERKEKDFLRELIRQKELRSLRVAFVSKEGQGLQPYQMEAIWAAIRQSGEVALANQHYQLDEMDKVFLLSDVNPLRAFEQMTERGKILSLTNKNSYEKKS